MAMQSVGGRVVQNIRPAIMSEVEGPDPARKWHPAGSAVSTERGIVSSAGPSWPPTVDRGGPSPDRQVVAQLVAAATEGDREAWDTLVERFSDLVWAVARAHRLNSADAADVSQAVWLKLVENLCRIREPGSVGAWLASVTRHECLLYIRRASRFTAVADVVQVESIRTTDCIDAAMLADERNTALRRALDRLPSRWRSLMQLLMAEPALSYREIAAALDMPIGSIGPIRQRCLIRLRSSPELTAIRAVAS